MRRLLALVRRDLRLAWRQGADATTAVLFFVLCLVLFPLGVGPEPAVLARVAPGVVWIAALLAALLSLDRLFAADAEDGSLDALRLSPLPLELTVLAKALAHWLATGLPLVIAAVPMALLLGMDAGALGTMAAALALGTPVLSLIGTVGAALTLGARRGGVLLSLLILPLDIPVLVFGAAAVDARLNGLTAGPHLAFLASLLIGTLVLAPPAAAAALRAAGD